MAWVTVAQGDGSNFSEDILSQYSAQFGPGQRGILEMRFADSPGIGGVIDYIVSNVSKNVQGVVSAQRVENAAQIKFIERSEVGVLAVIALIARWLFTLNWARILGGIWSGFLKILPWLAGWFVFKWVEERAEQLPETVKEGFDQIKRTVQENAPLFIGLGLIGMYFLANSMSSGSRRSGAPIESSGGKIIYIT